MPGFFDKVKESLEKGVNTVSTKSKELIDTTKLKGELGALEREKNEAITALGQMVHTTLQTGEFNIDKAKEMSDAIAKIEEKIKTKEAEIEAVHAKARDELDK